MQEWLAKSPIFVVFGSGYDNDRNHALKEKEVGLWKGWGICVDAITESFMMEVQVGAKRFLITHHELLLNSKVCLLAILKGSNC